MTETVSGPRWTVIESVEYWPDGIGYGSRRSKANQLYCGVQERKSDGITCLSILGPGDQRRHNIEVGMVEAITLAGKRYVLDTPPGRFRLREQEIVCLLEGDFSEEWARPYFDPESPKYYKNITPAQTRHLEAIELGPEPEPHPGIGPLPAEPPADRWRIARVIAWAIAIGYLLGRLRLIHWALHAFHQHWGLWL